MTLRYDDEILDQKERRMSISTVYCKTRAGRLPVSGTGGFHQTSDSEYLRNKASV